MSVCAAKEGLVPRFERNGPTKPLADGWGSRTRPRCSMNRELDSGLDREQKSAGEYYYAIGCDEEAVP